MTSSVAIAYYARLPRVVIGSTLVSLATTAPELTVSATASLRGNPGLAIGNAVGSAIVNIGVILGVLCILRPMNVRGRDFRLPAFVMLGSGILLFLLPRAAPRVGGGTEYLLTPWTGWVLLLVGVACLVGDYLRHRPRRGVEPETVDAADGPKASLRRSVVIFGIGAALVIGGSRLLCDNAVVLAARMHVPPMIIGLTLVAFGTSLPELVTAITAARKGVPELSLGNVIGANIMNITLVTGTAALLSAKPLRMSAYTRFYNFPAMIAIFILLIILARTGRRLSRAEGWVLVGFYAVYLVGLILIKE